EDRLHPRTIAQLQPGETATVVAAVRSVRAFPPRWGRNLFEAQLSEGPHRVRCRWFHAHYLKRMISPGQVLAVPGGVEEDHRGFGLQMVHTEFEVLIGEEQNELSGPTLEVGRVVPVYESAGSGRLTPRFFRRLIHSVLQQVGDIPDPLPQSVRAKLS